MPVLRTWLTRLGAVLGTMALVVLMPVVAWASSDTGMLVTDLAQRRRGIGRGLFGLCCLVGVGALVLLVLLVMRGRRSPR
ncbi:MAG TPA: hypothetical protein VFX60_01345 [Micromonospora sp.]|nr:hypothetical protein [Micromonospora sp.]